MIGILEESGEDGSESIKSVRFERMGRFLRKSRLARHGFWPTFELDGKNWKSKKNRFGTKDDIGLI